MVHYSGIWRQMLRGHRQRVRTEEMNAWLRMFIVIHHICGATGLLDLAWPSTSEDERIDKGSPKHPAPCPRTSD